MTDDENAMLTNPALVICPAPQPGAGPAPLPFDDFGKPFELDMTPAGDRPPFAPWAYNMRTLQVVHPCAAFAESAGYASWAQVVAAVQAGKIVQGRGPRFGEKSALDVHVFVGQVAAAGLTAKFYDLGMVAVGLPDCFPSDPARLNDDD